MRITQSMITRSLLQNINGNRQSMSTVQNTISTGKEVQSSSDDPVRFSRVSRFRKTMEQNQQYMRNIVDARGWVDMSGSLLEDVYNQILSVKNYTVQAADASNNESTRAMLASKIQNHLDEIVNLFNTQYLGRYLFGGTMTTAAGPFAIEGDTVTYNGNSGEVKRRIADNFDVVINITGQQVVDTNIFSSLKNLRTAMATNDLDGITTALSSIEGLAEQIQGLQSSLGSLKNQLSMTQNRLEISNTNLSSFISNEEDVDMVEAIAKYNAEELAYRAALKTASEALNLNLLNYLR